MSSPESIPNGPAPTRRPDAPDRRHCWVIDGNEKYPGLLLQWRNPTGRWQAHVAWTREDGELTLQWLDAQHVRPVE